MYNGKKLAYPIEFYVRKKAGVICILVGIMFLIFFKMFAPDAEEGFDKLMTYFNFLFGVLLLFYGGYALINNKPRYVLDYDGLTVNGLLGNQFFAWEDIISIDLDYMVARSQYGSGFKLWHFELVTNRHKTKKLRLGKLKVREDVLNEKESYHLIEQSFNQYTSRTIEPLTYKNIEMTRDDYRYGLKINKWIAIAIIGGWIAVFIFAALRITFNVG